MSLAVSFDQSFQCCSSTLFARHLESRGPFSSIDSLLQAARRIWWEEVPVSGWQDAFAAHPRIGDVEGLKKKYGAFADMSRGEQSVAASTADDTIFKELASWNKKYEEKFGHIFIICASGKTAAEMLAAIQSRYGNTPFSELGLAAAEQMKITELRLRKVWAAAGASPAPTSSCVERRSGAAAAPPPAPLRSPITTHVLDTCLGRPAEGVPVSLHRERAAPGEGEQWELVASGVTNKDGRVTDLLLPSPTMLPGHYHLTFHMAPYMQRCKANHPLFFAETPFFPLAVVHFSITSDTSHQHFHVPLTWTPYGYSTYRGS